MAEVGIDLGTTNSVVAHLRGKPEVIEVNGFPTLPSVVAWDDGEILVGKAAKDQAMVLPAIISVKRHMGTDKQLQLGPNTYSAVDISAMILKEMIRAVEERTGEPVDSAVITIPAYFSGAAAEATKQAGEKAGIKSVRLLAEPVAAAIAYGAEETVLVYDLGGGTFDVAIIDCFDYHMLSLDGDNYLGGDDFDNRLIAHLAKQVQTQFGVDINSVSEARQLAKKECERVKIELSTRNKATINFATVISGKPVNLNLKITREEFEALIQDLVERTIEKVENTIRLAAEKEGKFTKDDIDTVLLVGGSTYVPVVQKRLSEFFGKEGSKKVNPDLAVGLGAAIHTASGATPKGSHRVRLDPLPQVTREASCRVKGRTTPGARVEISGGAAAAAKEADTNGRFDIEIALLPGRINEIDVVATSSGGEVRKQGFHIQHNPDFSGEVKMDRRKTESVAIVLPRTLGVRVSGDKDRLGIIVQGQTEIPCSVEDRSYSVTSAVPNQPGVVPIDIFEGDLPYAPLNTFLATLTLQTPGTPNLQEPLEITFSMTEDRLLTASARLTNFPERSVTTKIDCKSASGNNLDVVERTDRLVMAGGDRLRPEDKTRLVKNKQALIDLCDQFGRNPSTSSETYDRIVKLSQEMKALLQQCERTAV